MKSFKQKQEEKQKRLDAERLIVEEKAFNIQQQKESDRIEQERLDEIAYNKALLKEQQEQENKIWEERESRQIINQQALEVQESEERNRQIEDYRKLKVIESEFRSAQKDTIKDILSGEDQVRETISSAERQLELTEYEDHQLQKIEDAEELLEQQLAEEKAKQKQEKLDEIAEQEKLSRWKENEKIEEDEKQRMKELRESQEKEKNAIEAVQLQEIISSREIYELRQKELAKEQQQTRININNILQEAQYILDSEKQTHQKNILSNLHDYIYKLNPTQKNDIWTDRKQPKAVLTWEEWKSVNTNNILIEQDFKRARLLFEQDNQRAQRYHDHMYQQFAARNLTLDRRKAIAKEGKLVDIPHTKLVEAREELVADIGDLQVWLDASDRPTIHTAITESINTASVSVSWVPLTTISPNVSTTMPSSSFSDSGSLVISGANALFDGDPDTYMSITHTSGSAEGLYDYDWRDRGAQDNAHILFRGIINIKFTLPAEYQNTAIESVQITSTDRKYIPTFVGYWNQSTDHPQGTYERLYWANITSSAIGNYNSQISAGGEAEGMGGLSGITPEGSASLDPWYMGGLYPRKLSPFINYYDNEILGYNNEYTLRVHAAATGSELRFHGFKAISIDITSSMGPSGHKAPVKSWLDKRYYRNELDYTYGPKARIGSGSRWNRSTGREVVDRASNGYSYPYYYSGSIGQPDNIDMPYIKFTSQSISNLACTTEFLDFANTDGNTMFFVLRDTTANSETDHTILSDAGHTYRQQLNTAFSGFSHGVKSTIVDWEFGVGQTMGTDSTRHRVQAQQSMYYNEIDMFERLLGINSASGWPYTEGRYPPPEGDMWHRSVIQGAHNRTETQMLVTQLDNPDWMTSAPSSSLYRMWFKGGTPFVDVDATLNTGYTLTGSYGKPVIGGDYFGGQWGDFELHEMLIFNKCLSMEQLETVSSYLNDKWKLQNIPFRSDKVGDFVYGMSSSDSSEDLWTYDGTTERTSTDSIFSASGWSLG